MAPVTGSSPADNRGGPNWVQPATNPQTHTETHAKPTMTWELHINKMKTVGCCEVHLEYLPQVKGTQFGSVWVTSIMDAPSATNRFHLNSMALPGPLPSPRTPIKTLSIYLDSPGWKERRGKTLLWLFINQVLAPSNFTLSFSHSLVHPLFIFIPETELPLPQQSSPPQHNFNQVR